MPRRQFLADLQKAQEDPPPGVLALEPGDDDGQIAFQYAVAGSAVKITAMIQDLGEYPKSHVYYLFCDDDAPGCVGQTLHDLHTERKSVYEVLDIVSTKLARLAPDRDGDVSMPDSQLDDEDEDVWDGDEDIYGSDDDFTVGGAAMTSLPATRTAAQTASTSLTNRAFRTRTRSDLRKAKDAGFKVGQLGHLLDGANCYVTVSIRMTKLGISEEAMQAWQVEPNEYLILILQYPNGYKTNEQLQGYDSLRLKPNIGMRVVASKKYKPSLQEAIGAFTKVKKHGRDSLSAGNDIAGPNDIVDENTIRDTFISKPLAALLEDRLVPILRYRSAGMSWGGAEEWYLQVAGAASGVLNPDAPPNQCFQPEPPSVALPDLMNRDHYQDGHAGPLSFSFPLLAMQFMLRHFVRCTEFCLICHRKLGNDLEAIKPYVCDSHLCLFQYMAMGFGPSIEHEILAQPYVVDLLVSFCYNSAYSRKLKEFPDGLALTVPPPNASQYSAAPAYDIYSRRSTQPANEQPSTITDTPKYQVGFDRARLEMIFHDKPGKCPITRGDWIVLESECTLDEREVDLHMRVKDATYFPTISLDEPIMMRSPINLQPGANSDTNGAQAQAKSIQGHPATPAMTPKWAPARFHAYKQDFEQLNSNDKCASICQLLDILPSVKQMQKYLARSQSADLKSWVERIPPAALSLLRWIIASNRACIMQNEDLSVGTPGPKSMAKQERLYGMSGYMQFRFAMGAPDKEQRFINEVRETTKRLKLEYPTIFAWHGSPLHNWHSIIREGLHFKEIAHGRAYGDGVYHAVDANTSTGYAGRYSYGGDAKATLPGTWQSSLLRISSALALNEIVNAPSEFTSQSPFYVVKQLDWIQTRYLFVQVTPVDESIKVGEEAQPSKAYAQDPKRKPRGISHSEIIIPASAIKGKKLEKVEEKKSFQEKFGSPFKKLKGAGGFSDPVVLDADDDGCSVVTDAEDRDMLVDEQEPSESILNTSIPLTGTKKPVKTTIEAAKTDFIPGILDFEKLPLMPMPQYANSGTTKRLMNELRNLAKVQDSSNLAELGWYIDTNKIENVYQWIVELHSFHMLSDARGKQLELVKDMKKAGVNSIVLEVRFGADFPYSPPYVRVIRPRFLGFNQGGGGHIVLGGAMCMELLTNTGWSSVSSMESVLMQIRMAIASDPPARMDNGYRGGDYGTGEAADGYLRACQTHGWQVPPGFKEMAYGAPGSSRY